MCKAGEQRSEAEVFVQPLQEQVAAKPLYLPGAAVSMQAMHSHAEYLYELPMQLTRCMIQAKDQLPINVAMSSFQWHVDHDVAKWHATSVW